MSRQYLTLRSICLEPNGKFAVKGEGLVFTFATGGVGGFVSHNQTYRLTTGDVLVSNAARAGTLYAAEGAELTLRSFRLSPEHLFPFFTGKEIPLLQNLASSFKGNRLYPASGRLATETQKLVAEILPEFNADYESRLVRVAATIVNQEFPHRQEDRLVEVFGRLSVDEMLSLSVPELAKRFSCSRRHLNRLFHQYFGFSVASLRMEMRLMKAVSLLRDCDAKIINVAEQCGFNHLALFTLCFRRRFGVSPDQWRKTVVPLTNPGLGFIGSGPRNMLVTPESFHSEPISANTEEKDFRSALEEQGTDFISRSAERIRRNLDKVSDSTSRMLQALERT